MIVKVWPKSPSVKLVFYEHVLSIFHNYDDSTVIIERTVNIRTDTESGEIIVDELPYMAFYHAEVLL